MNSKISFHPNKKTTPTAVATTPRPANNKRWLGYSLAFLFALGTFLSGFGFGQGIDSTNNQTAGLFNLFASEQVIVEETKPDLTEFWSVWELLEEKFVVGSTTANISDEERLRGAIAGLVESYDDPYTVFFPPVEADAFNENISGNFSGVGMEVGIRDNLITVIAPLPDTPAEQAGVLAGDVIVKIDDTTTEDMRIDQAVKLIRGEKGTVVVLQIFRAGEVEFIDIPVTRDTINIPTVKTEQIDDVFIISLYSFNAVAEAQVRSALKEYTKSKATRLVLDLRGNPGGFLQSSVSIASFFLPAGKIVVQEQSSDEDLNNEFRSRGGQIQLFNPKNLVVLVDGGSASASEILAGALKDHAVATIIGAQTFGKGSVQELVELDNGSSLKVTVARWLTPNGTSISEGGLAPDIIISRTPAHRVAEEDPQKDAAVSFLQGKEVISETFTTDLTNDEQATTTEKTGE